jgi:hypothetical protein
MGLYRLLEGQHYLNVKKLVEFRICCREAIHTYVFRKCNHLPEHRFGSCCHVSSMAKIIVIYRSIYLDSKRF